jgi:hypothetical protein
MRQLYKCMTCGAKKEIVAHTVMDYEDFLESLPLSVICGWRGCGERQVQVENDKS